MASTESLSMNLGYENHFLLTIIEKLYLKTELADVYFVFGDSDNRERVPAHKCLLAAGNDVFKAMFYGDLKEKGDVEITDASVDAFKEFLQFFYLDQVKLTVENAFDVVNLCKKYDVTACLKICDTFMCDEISLNNNSVCSVYEVAINFDLDDLIRQCESTIVVDPEAIFSSASFLDCDRSVLTRILKFDTLYCSEVKVFYACLNWVKAKAKKEELTKELIQAHLGDLFYEIRFGSMTLGELADLTISYGKLFSIEEYQEIVKMIRLKDFQPKMFKKDCRQAPVPQWNADAKIECSRCSGCYPEYFGEALIESLEETTFTASKPVLLGEIVFTVLSDEKDNSVPVEMTIREISSDGASKVLHNEQNVLFSPSNRTKQLPKPILIKPGFIYGIDIKNSSTKRMKYTSFCLLDKVQFCNRYSAKTIIQFLGGNCDYGIVYKLIFNQIEPIYPPNKH